MSVHPLRGNMHINQEPPSGGTPPGALEGGIDVILSVTAMKGQPDPRVNSLVITGQTVKVLEHAGVWSDPQLAFTQHYEAGECSKGVRVQVNKFTPKDVHDINKAFAGRRAKSSNKKRFDTNHGGAIYRGDVHLRDKRFQIAA
jgi:hypothetical protein